mmetsp:Transcript_19781/g.43007  ORF Transcript_19781/g.43007 Transcript_19781/m.43007 type:complete len:276 (+) Transcript_19781:166-993(+)
MCACMGPLHTQKPVQIPPGPHYFLLSFIPAPNLCQHTPAFQAGVQPTGLVSAGRLPLRRLASCSCVSLKEPSGWEGVMLKAQKEGESGEKTRPMRSVCGVSQSRSSHIQPSHSGSAQHRIWGYWASRRTSWALVVALLMRCHRPARGATLGKWSRRAAETERITRAMCSVSRSAATTSLSPSSRLMLLVQGGSSPLPPASLQTSSRIQVVAAALAPPSPRSPHTPTCTRLLLTSWGSRGLARKEDSLKGMLGPYSLRFQSCSQPSKSSTWSMGQG